MIFYFIANSFGEFLFPAYISATDSSFLHIFTYILLENKMFRVPWHAPLAFSEDKQFMLLISL